MGVLESHKIRPARFCETFMVFALEEGILRVIKRRTFYPQKVRASEGGGTRTVRKARRSRARALWAPESLPSSLSLSALVCGCVALLKLKSIFRHKISPLALVKRYHTCLFARVGVPSAFRRLLLFFFVRKVKDLLRKIVLL